MRIGALGLMGFAMLLAGCGSQTTSAKSGATGARAGAPYRLYTHCGIKWARIDGTFWLATRPLSDGHGNPPSGWGNPYQDGTLRLMSRRTANFSSSAGTVIFERTPRTDPSTICS